MILVCGQDDLRDTARPPCGGAPACPGLENNQRMPRHPASTGDMVSCWACRRPWQRRAPPGRGRSPRRRCAASWPCRPWASRWRRARRRRRTHLAVGSSHVDLTHRCRPPPPAPGAAAPPASSTSTRPSSDINALQSLVGFTEDFVVPNYYIRGAITRRPPPGGAHPDRAVGDRDPGQARRGALLALKLPTGTLVTARLPIGVVE
jgi:hypothetical protein